MQVEPAPLGFFEIEGERVELSAAAQPDKAVLPRLNVGLEDVVVLPPCDGRCAVRGNDKIVARRVIIRISDFSLEDQLHTPCHRASLEDLQQLDAGDSAKAVTAGSDLAALEEDINIVPVSESPADL